MIKTPYLVLPLVAVAALACGEDNTVDDGSGGSTANSSSSGSGSGGASQGSGGSGGSPLGEWETLIEGDWSMPSGSEGYVCVTATVPEDMFIGAFQPIAPQGTHHTVLTRGAIGPDGVFPCNASINGPDMVYGSGVGTMALSMPPGVAVKVEKGTKLLLNLHLFNTGDSTIAGTSGVQIRRMAETDGVVEGNSVLAGTTGINVPPQSTKTETGYCTMPAEVTIFAVGPHMHQYGTHMTVTAEMNDGDQILLDKPYTFDDQAHYPLANAITLQAGERVRVDCTYNNPTSGTVTFGDSSLQEMCFAGLFSYPASSGLALVCTN